MIKKLDLKNLKRKAMPLALISCVTLTVSGCTSEKTEEIGYNVTNSSDFRNSGIYNYILDTGLLSDENDENNENTKHFAQLTESTSDSSDDFFSKYAFAFSIYYNNSLCIVIPDEYACYSQLVFSETYFYITQNDRQYTTLEGEVYRVLETDYVAKEYLDSDHNIYDLKEYGYSEIQKGDIFSSTIVYKNGQIVGYSQYGAGSNSTNVIEFLKGNPEEFVTPVELDQTYDLTFTELDEIEYDLNNAVVKTLK